MTPTPARFGKALFVCYLSVFVNYDILIKFFCTASLRKYLCFIMLNLDLDLSCLVLDVIELLPQCVDKKVLV